MSAGVSLDGMSLDYPLGSTPIAEHAPKRSQTKKPPVSALSAQELQRKQLKNRESQRKIRQVNSRPASPLKGRELTAHRGQNRAIRENADLKAKNKSLQSQLPSLEMALGAPGFQGGTTPCIDFAVPQNGLPACVEMCSPSATTMVVGQFGIGKED
jgi:hypothetical protein